MFDALKNNYHLFFLTFILSPFRLKSLIGGGIWFATAGFSIDFSFTSFSFFLNEISYFSFFFLSPKSFLAEFYLALYLFFPNSKFL
jgi:hypothetical protein